MNPGLSRKSGWLAVCPAVICGLVGLSRVSASDLICCGGDEVFVVDPADTSIKKWTWRAADSPSIPEPFRAKFETTDDCKPYSGGVVLITSSSDGVALIDRGTKECLFLTESRNAHSACLLPQDQLVVASSYGGDQIQFYDLAGSDRPAAPIQTLPLVGAHGAVWDAQRSRLWMLGDNQILTLKADQQAHVSERWSVVMRYSLPTRGGHDLRPSSDGKRLLVTTNDNVYLFDRDTRSFSPHPQLADRPHIKSVDIHTQTGSLVFHQGVGNQWWSDTIRFVGRDSVKLAGERLYKVRWDVPADRPE